MQLERKSNQMHVRLSQSYSQRVQNTSSNFYKTSARIFSICLRFIACCNRWRDECYTENEKKKGDSNFNNRRVHIHKLTCIYIYICTSQDSFLESMRSGCHVAFSRRRCMQRAGGVIIVFLLFFRSIVRVNQLFCDFFFFENLRVFFLGTLVNACKIHENLGTAYKHYVQYHYIM